MYVNILFMWRVKGLDGQTEGGRDEGCSGLMLLSSDFF